MANLTNNPATSTSGSAKTYLVNNDSNIDVLASHFADSADPTSPVNGFLWWRTDVAGQYVLKARINGTSIAFLEVNSSTGLVLTANLQGNGKQLVDVLLEQLATGSLPTVEGRVWYDTTVDAHGGTSSSSAKRYFAYCNADATTYARIPLIMGVQAVGTPATASVATEMGGWLMDAAAEELVGVSGVPIPAGFTGANDCTLAVRCLLANAETANDTINIGGNWIAITPGSGDGAGKTETAIAADASLDITAANAQYDLHEVTLVVDYDHADNPIVAGDTFRCTINHDIAAGANPVNGIIVVGMDLKVPVFNRAD